MYRTDDQLEHEGFTHSHLTKEESLKSELRQKSVNQGRKNRVWL